MFTYDVLFLVRKDDGLLVIHRLLERPVGTLHFMVGQDLGLEVSALPLHLSGIYILQNGTLRHHHDVDLGLTATAHLLGIVVLGRGLYREISLVRLDHPLQGVTVVPLTHDLAQFMYHRPYGLVALGPELALDFLGGEPLLCGAQQKYGLLLYHKGKLGALHYGAASQRYPCLARFALIDPFVPEQVVVGPLTAVADHAFLFALLLVMEAATYFVGKVHFQREYVHFSTTFGSPEYTITRPI